MVNRIFRNTLALTIASSGQLVGNIILFFYLSRMLQAEGLGIYSTIIAVFHSVILGCAVVNPFIPRELSKDLTKTNRYLIHGSLISAAVAIVLTLGLDLLVPFLGYLPQTKTGLYIISIAILPEALNVVVYTIFISHQKAKYISITSVIVILGRILISLLVLRLGFGVISLVVVYASFSYISLLINLILLGRHIEIPRWEVNFPFLTNMVRELKYFAGTTLLNMLFSQSEVIILSLMAGETQVGFYSASLKLVTVWTMLPTSYATAVFPVLSATYEESHDKAVDLQNRSLKYLLALAIPLALGIFLTAGMIIPLFYGPGFDESISTLRILAWYLPLAFCNMVLYRMLYVRNEQHIVFRVQLIIEIVQVVLAVLLIPKLGSNGAALALIGGNFLYTLLSVYYVQRDKTPLPLLRITWRFIIGSIVMGLFTWFFASRINLLILIPAAVIIYMGMLWLLHAFSAADLQIFKQVLKLSKTVQPVQQAPATIDYEE
jgi:O-antigen/teichoic acid export membrane protein